jgi:hypothetical protein
MMAMWTIYDRPSDHPYSYVACHWGVTSGDIATQHQIFSDNLQWLRAHMMGLGLVRLLRHDEDDPSIVESWL